VICPRCGHDASDEAACARCGVVFGKLRAAGEAEDRRTRPRPEAAPPTPPSHARWGAIGPWIVLVALVAGIAGLARLRRGGPTPPIIAEAPASSSTGGPVVAPDEGPPPSLAAVALPSLAPPPAAEGLTDADRETARALGVRVTSSVPLSDADVQTAQDLFDRIPEPPLRDLLEATLLARGAQERGARQYAAAAAHLERATAVAPTSARGPKALLGLMLETGDWSRAETAGRTALARAPADPEIYQGLAFALVREDKTREAVELLRSGLEAVDDTGMRTLLARLEKTLQDERGMTEQSLAHFHVRYDGAEHQDVGREILRALERHFATLAQALDHRPEAPVAVILFSSQGYYNASGAPAWSGGAYDLTDGRIRIPIGGLTASLTPDIDETLLHELTHAFVWDRTHGVAPRDLQEGLAQFMEGKRTAQMLSKDQLRALADGRLGGVGGFYVGALSFVEYLEALRGQGGINDLLKAMGDGGSVDEAYKQVYGQDEKGMRRAWAQRMDQLYGS
jgi:hypothetical protein